MFREGSIRPILDFTRNEILQRVATMAVLVTLLVACAGDSTTSAGDVPIDVGVDVAIDVFVDVGMDTGAEADAVRPDSLGDAAIDSTGAKDSVVEDTVDLPPRICREGGTLWASGVKAFSDITAETTLPVLGVTGIRLGAVDIDNDGDADLSVRNAGNQRTDFSGAGARMTWLLRNDGGFQFTDVTQVSGITAIRGGDGAQGRLTHALVFGDIDNDGDNDALSAINVEVLADLGDRNEIFINNGDGTFTMAEGGDIRHADEVQPAFAASLTDYDRDGLLDAFVGYAWSGFLVMPDRLYRGDGSGGFSDVTEDVGMMTKTDFFIQDKLDGKTHRNTWGTSVCDVNGDGWSDLLCAVYGRDFNALWLNSGDTKTFSNIGIASGYSADDRVEWRDSIGAQCYCQENPEAEGCDTCPAPPNNIDCTYARAWDHARDTQLYRLGGNTFSTACGDVDNDGDLDLMTFEIVHWDVGSNSDPAELLFNDGAAQPKFSRPGAEALGMARDWDGHIDYNAGDMTGGFLDFDNDGRLDVLVCSSDYPYTRSFLWHQKSDGTFEEVSVDVGIDQPHAHGLAVADFDGDGDLDVILGHSRARCATDDPECYPTQEVHVFRNDLGQDGNWLRVTLKGGEGANRSAIGAWIKVTAGGQTQLREVQGGYGHVGIQAEFVQHFGLGSACDVDRIEVRWPDVAGTTEVFENVRANYEIRIAQGTGNVEYLGVE